MHSYAASGGVSGDSSSATGAGGRERGQPGGTSGARQYSLRGRSTPPPLPSWDSDSEDGWGDSTGEGGGGGAGAGACASKRRRWRVDGTDSEWTAEGQSDVEEARPSRCAKRRRPWRISLRNAGGYAAVAASPPRAAAASPAASPSGVEQHAEAASSTDSVGTPALQQPRFAGKYAIWVITPEMANSLAWDLSNSAVAQNWGTLKSACAARIRRYLCGEDNPVFLYRRNRTKLLVWHRSGLNKAERTRLGEPQTVLASGRPWKVRFTGNAAAKRSKTNLNPMPEILGELRKNSAAAQVALGFDDRVLSSALNTKDVSLSDWTGMMWEVLRYKLWNPRNFLKGNIKDADCNCLHYVLAESSRRALCDDRALARATNAAGFCADHLLWPDKPGLRRLAANDGGMVRFAIYRGLKEVDPFHLVTSENLMSVAGFLASVITRMQLSLQFDESTCDAQSPSGKPVEAGAKQRRGRTWRDSTYEYWLGVSAFQLRGLIFGRAVVTPDGETRRKPFERFTEVWPEATEAECNAWKARKSAYVRAWYKAQKEEEKAREASRLACKLEGSWDELLVGLL